MFSLENYRLVVNKYIPKDGATFIPIFSYTDTKGFFDPYKTSTSSSSAGRQRLLTDEIEVKDGLLWYNGKHMFEYMVEGTAPNLDISSISNSPYCHNNKSKRIMMNSKMLAQAIEVKDEKDSLTHRIEARACLADLKGYTYADAIVISESFAKKLTSHQKDRISIENSSELFDVLMDKFEKDEELTLEDLKEMLPLKSIPILDKYKNVKIVNIEKINKYKSFITYEYDLPFGLGDKISNMHGAKGVVGLILPDDKMPVLKHKVGNIEPGPVEVVVSSFSTIRRGSLGQIFELWDKASNKNTERGKDLIGIVSKENKEEMVNYSANSILEFEGVESIKPVGIMDIVRVHHHSSTKVSESHLKPYLVKSLKLGEMEKLNLIANGAKNILKELSIRSVSKHIGAYRMAMEMQETLELPENPILSLKFARLLKSMGYSIQLDGVDIIESDNRRVDYIPEEYDYDLNEAIDSSMFNKNVNYNKKK